MDGSYKVYMHTNKINGKKYIGITRQQTKSRWRKNGEGYKNQPYFYRSILKYGWKNFKHEVLLTGIDEETAKKKEVEFIAKNDTTNPYKGYNIGIGGEGILGYRPSEETIIKLIVSHLGKKLPKEQREKISKSNLGRVVSDETKRKISVAKKGLRKGISPWNKGRKLSSETRKKIGNSKRGKKLSEEHKRKIGENNGKPMLGKHHSSDAKIKMSIAKQGVYRGANHPFYGKHHSDESKEKISKNRRIHLSCDDISEMSKMYINGLSMDDIGNVFNVSWATVRRRLIENGTYTEQVELRKEKNNAKTAIRMSRKVINVDTGIVFNSQKAAAEFYGIGKSHIVSCCNGQRKTTGGYRWEYAN